MDWICDADYTVQPRADGIKLKSCPYYVVWSSMKFRCDGRRKGRRTYEDVTACEDWHSFINFKSWMELQDWEGKQLDKDILIKGNKIYSPESSRFIPARINSLFLDSGAIRGDLPLGVTKTSSGKYASQIRIGERNRLRSLFDDPLAAHLFWVEHKALLIETIIQEWEESERKLPEIYSALQDRVIVLRSALLLREEVFSL